MLTNLVSFFQLFYRKQYAQSRLTQMYQSNQNKYDELSDAYDETRPFLHNRQMVYIKARRGNHLVYLFKRGL